MIATSSPAAGRPGRAKLRAAARASSYAAVASWDLYPAPRWTLEYRGTNASTAARTSPSAPVEAAASNDKYGRSLPSAHGTGIPSPTSGTGGAGASDGGSGTRAGAARYPGSSSPFPGRSGERDVTMARLPQEVPLVGELHGVRLRPGDQQPVLARRQHLVGQDDHAVVARVHHAHCRDLAEGLLVGGRLAPDLCRDVARRHVRHPLGGESGLGDTHGGGCLPRQVDGGRDAGGCQREGDVRGAPPAEREPDQRRVEQEPVGGGDCPHVHVAAQRMPDGQRRGEPEVSSEYQHLLAAHDSISLIVSRPRSAPGSTENT